MFAYSIVHVCGLLNSQKYVKSFSEPLWTSYSPAFPFLSPWLVCCLPRLLSAATGSCDVNHCLLNCFSQMLPEKKLFALGKILNMPPPPKKKKKKDNSLIMRLWRSSSLHLPFPVATRLLVFTMISGYWLLRLPLSYRGVNGNRKVKMTKRTKLFLWRSSHFS